MSAPDDRLTEPLIPYGWDSHWQRQWQSVSRPETLPARVIAQHRGEYRVVSALGDLRAVTPGRMLHRARGALELPAVGDWLAVRPEDLEGTVTVTEILPRRTRFVRRAAGNQTREQVVAANVDTVLLMTSMNADFNPRRLERYLAAAWDSGAAPVIVLSKADLAVDRASFEVPAEAIAAGAPVHVMSCVTGEGLDAIREYVVAGATVAVLGSSGVGKSTLINSLAGHEMLRTEEIRGSDDRGRHTTTHRELFLMPDGGLVLDTPGMRELQLWEADEGVTEAFDDVEEIVASCRFRDCTHGNEPGCAVRQALESGELAPRRWAGFEKLHKELAYEHRRRDKGAELAEKQRWKKIHMDYRKRPKKGR